MFVVVVWKFIVVMLFLLSRFKSLKHDGVVPAPLVKHAEIAFHF